MALQTIPGEGLWIPRPLPVNIGPSFSAGLTIDATGEKAAFVGRVWNKDRATKSISRVGFRFGTITKAGGSGLTVSLQDVSLTASPGQPDETQDQTVAIANGDASFASNTWIRTGALSTDRSVAFGERLAVVIEFDGSGRQGADSVVIAGFNPVGVTQQVLTASSVLKTGGTWAVATPIPNLVLEFSDGTFGTLAGSYIASDTSTVALNTSTSPDEVALEFSLPFPCKVDGVWAAISPPADADFEIVLYDGTTAMTNGTITVDQRELRGTVAGTLFMPFPAEVSLVANTTYRLAIKPTTTTSLTVYYQDIASADHRQALPFGTSGAYVTRVDGGSWAAATTTRRPMLGLHVSAFDDGAGGGVADYPSEDDVRFGVSYDSGGQTGNMTLPAETDVETGVQYGTNGTEFTGTLDAGGGGDIAMKRGTMRGGF